MGSVVLNYLYCLSNKQYRFEYGLVQLSFQEWTQQMRDMLEARKRGDYAFRDKDFKIAIDNYSQVQFSTCSTFANDCSLAMCMLIIELLLHCSTCAVY